jgi:hypothetical protein
VACLNAQQPSPVCNDIVLLREVFENVSGESRDISKRICIITGSMALLALIGLLGLKGDIYDI